MLISHLLTVFPTYLPYTHSSPPSLPIPHPYVPPTVPLPSLDPSAPFLNLNLPFLFLFLKFEHLPLCNPHPNTLLIPRVSLRFFSPPRVTSKLFPSPRHQPLFTLLYLPLYNPTYFPYIFYFKYFV